MKYMMDMYKISEKKSYDIIAKRDQMLQSLFYYTINLVLFQEPEGTPRHRYRLINRKNFVDAAISNPNFIHVYQPGAKEDSMYMKRLLGEELLLQKQLNDSLICTPINVHYKTFFKPPSNTNIEDMFLAEMGLIRPPCSKPDWDNIGKKQSDMSNENIWLDDSFVIDGHVSKYYSILPRIEVQIQYLNMLYNKQQYNAVTARKDFQKHNCHVDYFKKEG